MLETNTDTHTNETARVYRTVWYLDAPIHNDMSRIIISTCALLFGLTLAIGPLIDRNRRINWQQQKYEQYQEETLLNPSSTKGEVMAEDPLETPEYIETIIPQTSNEEAIDSELGKEPSDSSKLEQESDIKLTLGDDFYLDPNTGEIFSQPDGDTSLDIGTSRIKKSRELKD